MTSLKAEELKGHVHFGDENLSTKKNTVTIVDNGGGVIQVHLGILQLRHTYQVLVEIATSSLFDASYETIVEALDKSMPNLNCKLLSLDRNADTFTFVVEFHARKDKLQKEELKMILEGGKIVSLTFIARVLGPGKGTPLLKDGIKCIAVELDENSEVSDWQGFD